MRMNGESFYISPWATGNTLHHAPGIATHDHTSHIAQHPNTCRIAVMLCIIPQHSITHPHDTVEPYGINSARVYQRSCSYRSIRIWCLLTLLVKIGRLMCRPVW